MPLWGKSPCNFHNIQEKMKHNSVKGTNQNSPTFLPREAGLSPSYSCRAWTLTVLRSLCVSPSAVWKKVLLLPRAPSLKKKPCNRKKWGELSHGCCMCRVLPQELLPGSGSLGWNGWRDCERPSFAHRGVRVRACVRVHWAQTGWCTDWMIVRVCEVKLELSCKSKSRSTSQVSLNNSK